MQELLQKSVSFLVTSIGSLVQGIVAAGVFIAVMGFSTSYFLDHGKNIKETIMRLLPLRAQDKDRIMERLEETMNAVIMGNVSTSFLQGIVGGIIFALAGVPAAAFFGFLMAILAFIPAVGPALIWLPAAVYIAVIGSPWKGVLMGVACLLLLGSIDNVLKPKLIGNKLKLSSFAVFLGVLGGLKLFGIFGLILGPVLFALLATCVNIYQEMIK
ncbi:TPA: AI-2E family transporter [Candidatus Woesearchaeota archaeon]|nr:AI-2E family transporter [Candidatus Woesearchaeota archaeon]